MTGSSCPTIASTFWKKLIHGAIACDQSTFFDSSSCSRKFPAVWKNFFGAIGARSRVSGSGTRSPVSSAPPRSNHSRMVATSRTAISSPSSHPTRLSSPNVTSFTRLGLLSTRACVGSTQALSRHPAHAHRDPGVDLGRADEAVDLEVLAERDVHQARRRPVVDGRDAVPRQRRGVREPARDVAARLLAEHPLVRLVDRRDERMLFLDLG